MHEKKRVTLAHGFKNSSPGLDGPLAWGSLMGSAGARKEKRTRRAWGPFWEVGTSSWVPPAAGLQHSPKHPVD